MSGIWDLYNLSGNPFFQNPLGDDTVGRQLSLRDLFVGREADVDLALRTTTHDTATRTVIVGDPGVGKTTLLNRVRAELEEMRRDDGALRFRTHSPALSVQSRWTALDFCAEILRTILLMRAGGGSTAAPEGFFRRLSGVLGQATTSPTFWERIAQIVEGRQYVGVGMQAGPVGGTVQPGWSGPTLPPASLMLVTSDAIRVACEEMGVELVFFLDNLENLSREDAAHAAGIFQDVRDLFLTTGSHWVVCGTTEVEPRVVRASVQVSGIFPTAIRLASLTPAEIVELLRRRYRALQKGTAPFTPPVAAEAVASLARAYQGDLRNFLRLLQDTVLRTAGPRGASPVEATWIVGIMGREHALAMERSLSSASWSHFMKTVLSDSLEEPLHWEFTQAEAARRCGVSAPAIKRHMEQWLERGYVLRDRIEGKSEWVRLGGETVIAFVALKVESRGLGIPTVEDLSLLPPAGAPDDP